MSVTPTPSRASYEIVLEGHEPLPDFRRASATVLDFLHRELGLALWVVTRTAGPDEVVLTAHDGNPDAGYGIHDGDVLRPGKTAWLRMTPGMPGSAPAELPVGTVLCAPLVIADAEPFGLLCALDPAVSPDVLARGQPLVDVQARLLSTLLAAEYRVLQEQRRAERAEADAEMDSLTGLRNRRGWERLLAAEEARCRRYGTPASIIVIDLDDLKRVNDTRGHRAGDALIVRAGNELLKGCRDSDVVARLGGDEFGMLVVETDAASARALGERLATRLSGQGVSASVGVSGRNPKLGLARAWSLADKRMYAVKRARKEDRL